MDTLHVVDPVMALLSPRVQMQKGIDDSEDTERTAAKKATISAKEQMKQNKRDAIEAFLDEQQAFVSELSVILEVRPCHILI